MTYKMCKICGKKLRKKKVYDPIIKGKLVFKTYCPHCNPNMIL